MRRIIEEYQPRSEELIESLTSEYQWLPLLKGQGKRYETLLDSLYELGCALSGMNQFHSFIYHRVSKLAEGSGVKASNKKKWLKMIYEDLIDLNYENPNLFNTKQNTHCHVINISSGKYKLYAFTIWLPIKLCRFDNFDFPFVKSKIGSSNLWIRNINNIHKYGKTVFWIEAELGRPNLYRELLLEKFIFMNEIISIRNSSSYEMDEELRKYGRREKL